MPSITLMIAKTVTQDSLIATTDQISFAKLNSCHLLRLLAASSFVLHDLRRTFITMAAKLGVAHHIIKKLVNHITSVGATDGYIVLHVEHLREAMAQITNRFLTLFGCTLNDWNPDICRLINC